MIIEKIHINYFGNLVNRTFELKPGLNIIEGDNETGKSTIAAFIKFVFYGLSSKSKDCEISERDRYINWHDGSAAGSLVINTGKARYRIERAIIISGQKNENGSVRKTYRDAVQTIDLTNNSPVTLTCSPGEHFFGVDEEVYRKTSFVSQADGTKVSSDKLVSAIENILFSASEDINIDKALKKLDSARVHLLHKNESGGQIFELETKCAMLEEKLEEAKKVGAQILEAEASLLDAKKVYEKNKAEKSSLDNDIKAFENTTLKSLFEKLHVLEKKLAEAQNKQTETTQKYTINDFFPTREYIKELEGAKSLCDSAKAEIFELESKAEKAEKESRGNTENRYGDVFEKLSSLKGKKRFLSSLAITFAVISLLFLLCGGASIYLSFIDEIGKSLIFASALPILLTVIFFAARISAAKKLKDFTELYGAETEAELKKKLESSDSTGFDTEEKLARSKKALLADTAKLDKLSGRWQKGDDVNSRIKLAREAVEDHDKAKAECEKYGNMVEMLKKQLEPYDENTVMTYEAADAELTGIDASNINEKRKALNFLTKSTEALEIRIHELEKKLASLYPLAENPARIAEKIDLARDFIREYRKKHAAYLLAGEKIAEAGESMRENVAPKLAEYTSRLMGEVTDGKYTEIGIDNELNVSVFTDGQTRALGYLSAGTQDAAYISLRLALINVLFKNESPCIMFDESFACLDSTRLTSALRLVGGKHTGYQSIILTSGAREASIAKDLCNCGYIKLQS